MDWKAFLTNNHDVFESPFETLFVESVLAKVPGLDPQHVSCQTPFIDSRGIERRVDFTISEGEGVRVALEVDGWDKRGRGTGMSRTEFMAWSRRELDLTAQGWTVLRIANSLVTHWAAECARDVELTLAKARARANASSALPDERDPPSLSPEQEAELAKLEHQRQAALQELELKLTAAEKENRGMKSIAWAFSLAVIAMALVTIVLLTQRSPATQPSPPADEVVPFCSGDLRWDQAQSHLGAVVSVYGEVVETTFRSDTSGEPTFLNVGRPFPDPQRLTVVIWGTNRSRFPEAPERMYQGKTICVTGTVGVYQGRTEIEVSLPASITVR